MKIQIVTSIDLSKLYDFTERKPEKASCELLREILKFYNIKAKLIASINPDIDAIVVCENDSIKYVNVDIEKLLRDCEYVIELFDGYEKSIACIE